VSRSRPGPRAAGLALPELQAWFQNAIVSPHERGSRRPGRAREARLRDVPVEAVLTRSRALTARERLAVYVNGYFARLHDALATDYPVIHRILGDEAFHALARAYLARHPSRSYTLNILGAALPRFLDDPRLRVRGLRRRTLLRDLARIELAMSQAIDADERRPLTAADLAAACPTAAWPGARLETIPALALLALDHPANAVVTAVRQDRPLPDHALSNAFRVKVRERTAEEAAAPAFDAAAVARRPTWVAVYRKEYRIWRMDLSESGFAALSALKAGKTVGAAVRAAARAFPGDAAALAERIRAWFADWVAEGIFCGVRV